MRLFDRQRRARERAMTHASPARRARPATCPAIARWSASPIPTTSRAPAFLVWEQPAGDDERFLYLPSLGRVRRIAGSEAQESFVGSDFTYEDIGGREFEDYTYRSSIGRDATWTAADGSTHAVYRLESRRREPTARFPRVVSLVRKDNFVVVHAEIYNRRDEVQKTSTAREAREGRRLLDRRSRCA